MLPTQDSCLYEKQSKTVDSNSSARISEGEVLTVLFKPEPLTPRETDLLKTLRTHMRLEAETTFTVDTLRQLGYDRYMPLDKAGNRNYGSFMVKLKYYEHAEPCGWTASVAEANHGRKVQVWKMKQP